MTKQDYVATVSNHTKWTAVVALLLGTLVSAACFLIVLAVTIVGIDDAPTGPLYGCIAIFGTLTFASGWMLVRLIRHRRASNGRTVMPEWFIQLFGCVFLIGLCATAMFNGRMWLFAEAFGVAVAMIGIRSLLNQPH